MLKKYKHFEEQLRKLISDGYYMDSEEKEHEYKGKYMLAIKEYPIDQVVQLFKMNIRNQHMKMMQLRMESQVKGKKRLVEELRRIEVNIECCEEEIERRCE